MKLISALVRLVLLTISVTALTAAASAQPAPRTAPPNDNRANRMPIHPNAAFIINDVEQATIEGGELMHTCHPGAPSAGVNSVWFGFAVPQGTVTIDTTGTAYNSVGSTSIDSIISVYTESGLVPVGCSDNGTASGQITLPVGFGRYLLQVSAVAGTTVTLPSIVSLSISFAANDFVSPADTFASAAKLPLPNNPTLIGFSGGTLELGEAAPSCTSAGRDSHSFWYKFSVTKTTTLIVSTLNLNIFTFDGTSLSSFLFTLYKAPASGFPQGSDEVTCANNSIGVNYLPPGTYYLRVSADTAGGSYGTQLASFYSIIGRAPNLSFEVSDEAADTNDPLLSPWKVKGSNGGDAVVCGISTPLGDCVFRFTNTAGENTTLQTKASLVDLKLKKGDVLFGQMFYRSAVVPDASVTITATYPDGTKSVSESILVQDPFFNTKILEIVPLKGKPTRIVLKLKNKTTVGTLEVDGFLIAVTRIGTASRGALAAPAAGVRPLPPPP